jgi:hypothetical protein
MLPQLIAIAAASALAKKGWDHYQQSRRRPPEDITNLVARPEAVEPPKAKSQRKEAAPSRRSSERPSS